MACDDADLGAFIARLRETGATRDLVLVVVPIQEAIDRVMAQKRGTVAPEEFQRWCAARWEMVRDDPDVHRLCWDAALRAGRGDLGARLRHVGYDALDDRDRWLMTVLLKYVLGYLLRDTQLNVGRKFVTPDLIRIAELATSPSEIPSDLAHFHKIAGLHEGFGEALDRAVGGNNRPAATAQGCAAQEAVGFAWERLADREKARPIRTAIRQARTEAIKQEMRGGLDEKEYDHRTRLGLVVGLSETAHADEEDARSASPPATAALRARVRQAMRSPAAIAADDERRDRARRALEKLPDDEREVLLALEVEEVSAREVARRRGTNHHTIQRAHERGMRKFLEGLL